MLGIYKINKSSYVIQIKRTEWEPAKQNSTRHLVLSFWNVEFSLWKRETLFSPRLFAIPLNIRLCQVRRHARVNDLRLTLRVCSVVFATALNNLKSSLFGQEMKESLRRRLGCSALDQLTPFTWVVLQNMSQRSVEVCRRLHVVQSGGRKHGSMSLLFLFCITYQGCLNVWTAMWLLAGACCYF